MPLGCVREGEGGKQHRRGVPQSGGRALWGFGWIVVLGMIFATKLILFPFHNLFLPGKQLKYSFSILCFKNIKHKDQHVCFHSVVPDITHHTRTTCVFFNCVLFSVRSCFFLEVQVWSSVFGSPFVERMHKFLFLVCFNKCHRFYYVGGSSCSVLGFENLVSRGRERILVWRLNGDGW